MNSINTNFYKTFSGTDTIAFIMLPNTTPIVLGSLTTFSYSTYREKRPVSLLGKVNVAGYTRGVRTVAGTMIFTLINQHWVNELKEEIKALDEFDSLKGDELPLFDIMLVSANEYGSVVQGYLYGVDITGDGGIISIEDMFSENTVNYVARDLDLLNNFDPLSESLSMDGKSASNSVSVSLGGYEYIEKDKEVDAQINPIKFDDINTNKEVIEISLDNIKADDVVINNTFNEGKICCLAYYQGRSKSYIKDFKYKENIKFKDISNAFLFDLDSNSTPSNIEVLINSNNILNKYIFKVL